MFCVMVYVSLFVTNFIANKTKHYLNKSVQRDATAAQSIFLERIWKTLIQVSLHHSKTFVTNFTHDGAPERQHIESQNQFFVFLYHKQDNE